MHAAENLDNKVPDALKSGPCGRLWSGRVVPLVMPNQAKTTTGILSKVMTRSSANSALAEVEADNDEDSPQVKITYDVFMPLTKFKKSAAGREQPPDYRVVVCTPSDGDVTAQTVLPSYPEVVRVTSKCKDKVPVLFAVSKHGSLSYYCFSAVGLPTLISIG